jgi:hypothetical protein
VVSGLGATQNRRKEKAGPKKVRLSKMKKPNPNPTPNPNPNPNPSPNPNPDQVRLLPALERRRVRAARTLPLHLRLHGVMGRG